jgi:hypothetical protein
MVMLPNSREPLSGTTASGPASAKTPPLAKPWRFWKAKVFGLVCIVLT